MDPSDRSCPTAAPGPSPTPLTFSLVEGWRVRNPFGLVEWMLRFQAPRHTDDQVPLQLLRIQGVEPSHLMNLRVSRDGVPIFALEATYDVVGRAITAGEILLCQYGEDRLGGVRVSAAEFDLPVAARQAEVELSVRCAEAALIECITVSAVVG